MEETRWLAGASPYSWARRHRYTWVTLGAGPLARLRSLDSGYSPCVPMGAEKLFFAKLDKLDLVSPSASANRGSPYYATDTTTASPKQKAWSSCAATFRFSPFLVSFHSTPRHSLSLRFILSFCRTHTHTHTHIHTYTLYLVLIPPHSINTTHTPPKMRSSILAAATFALGALATPTLMKRDCNDTCMTYDQAAKVANNFQTLIANYSDALADATLTVDFQDYSDSVTTLIDSGCTSPQPLGSVTFDGRAAFEAGQGAQPPIPFEILNLWYACTGPVVIRWRSAQSPEEITGNIVLETARGNGSEPWLIVSRI